MAPKKKQQQTMSLGDFLSDGLGGGGSWADEVEETYVTGMYLNATNQRVVPCSMLTPWI
jgi:hypothetical protein